jgi:hypothetical protein
MIAYKRLTQGIYRYQEQRVDLRTREIVEVRRELYLAQDPEGNWWWSPISDSLAEVDKGGYPSLEWPKEGVPIEGAGATPLTVVRGMEFERVMGPLLRGMSIGEESYASWRHWP